MFTSLKSDGTADKTEVFADGWLDAATGLYRGRPVDVAMMKGGSMLIRDQRPAMTPRSRPGPARLRADGWQNQRIFTRFERQPAGLPSPPRPAGPLPHRLPGAPMSRVMLPLSATPRPGRSWPQTPRADRR